jgi:hypothetical protein
VHLSNVSTTAGADDAATICAAEVETVAIESCEVCGVMTWGAGWHLMDDDQVVLCDECFAELVTPYLRGPVRPAPASGSAGAGRL